MFSLFRICGGIGCGGSVRCASQVGRLYKGHFSLGLVACECCLVPFA